MSLCSPALDRLVSGSAVLAAVAVLTIGCTPAPPQNGSTTAAPSASATASPTLETGRNGRTVLPTAASTACGLVDEPAIRSSLGAVADSIQPAQPDAERTPEGVIYDSCIHALDAGGATTNALTVQLITYPSVEEADRANPYGLLVDPEDVAGLKHPAKYSMLDLSTSTEFVLVSVDGARIVKLIVALPKDTAWDKSSGRASLLRLAQAAGL